eukprot:jgi/Picre1/30531/NNA_005894.t1
MLSTLPATGQKVPSSEQIESDDRALFILLPSKVSLSRVTRDSVTIEWKPTVVPGVQYDIICVEPGNSCMDTPQGTPARNIPKSEISATVTDLNPDTDYQCFVVTYAKSIMVCEDPVDVYTGIKLLSPPTAMLPNRGQTFTMIVETDVPTDMILDLPLSLRVPLVFPILATVVVPVLQKDTLIIDLDSNLVKFDPEIPLIAFFSGSTPSGLEIGSILVSSGPDGLLHEVINIRTDSGTTEAELALVTFYDAFEEYDLNFALPILPGNPADSRSSFIKREDSGLSISEKTFKLAYVGKVGVECQTGTVLLKGTASGKLACALDLIEISIKPGLVFGPGLSLTPALKPQLGVDLEVKAEGQVGFQGPVFTIFLEGSAGVLYNPKSGLMSTGFDSGIVRQVTWPTSQPNKVAFSASIEPFAKLTIGGALGSVIPLVPNLGDFDLAEFRAGVPGELKLENPLDKKDRQYLGPNWEVSANVKAGLDPLQKYADDLADRISRLFDITMVTVDIFGTIFEKKELLKKSPKPSIVSIDPQDGGDSYRISVGIDALQSDQTAVEILAFKDGEDNPIEVGKTNAQGLLFWNDPPQDVTDYILKPLAPGIFTSTLPYGTDQEFPIIDTVQCDDAVQSGGQTTSVTQVVGIGKNKEFTFFWQAFSVPDEFRIYGQQSYLSGGSPIFTVKAGDPLSDCGQLTPTSPGSGSKSFPNGLPNDEEIAVVEVIAPCSGTAWEFNLECSGQSK